MRGSSAGRSECWPGSTPWPDFARGAISWWSTSVSSSAGAAARSARWAARSPRLTRRRARSPRRRSGAGKRASGALPTAMGERGELVPGTDPGKLATATLAALQGALLLTQIQRSTDPLEVTLDTVINHVPLPDPARGGRVGSTTFSGLSGRRDRVFSQAHISPCARAPTFSPHRPFLSFWIRRSRNSLLRSAAGIRWIRQSKTEGVCTAMSTQELAGRTAFVSWGDERDRARPAHLALAGLGARVLAAGRDEGRGEQVVKDIRAEGGEADFLPADLHDAASARRLARRASPAAGGPS